MDYLAILANNINYLQLQIDKLLKFEEWAYMDLNIVKCTNTSNQKNIKTYTYHLQHLHTNTRNYIQRKIISHKDQKRPCTYLGIQLVPSLKWQIQKIHNHNNVNKQSKLLLDSPPPPLQSGKKFKSSTY